jgi:hypothetical protein
MKFQFSAFKGKEGLKNKYFRLYLTNVRYSKSILFFTVTQTAPVGQGLLITENSRSHLETPQAEGLVWKSDQPDAVTSYLTTHNTHKRRTSMPPAGLEPTIPTGERPQTNALDRAAAGIGIVTITIVNRSLNSINYAYSLATFTTEIEIFEKYVPEISPDCLVYFLHYS